MDQVTNVVLDPALTLELATDMGRNPHAGDPIEDSARVVEAALRDVSVPALLCSLVHMTGDPAWIRGPIRPRVAVSLDIQSGLPEEEQDEVRRRALAVIADYRDGGSVPHELPRELLLEMMAFIACRPVEGALAGLVTDDLQFEGGDSGAVTWGTDVPEDVRGASPVVVIGCGMAGILAGIRLRQAGLPFTIIDKNDGPGGTWWENSYPGARVDIGSHQYCYSFEPADHWSEFYCQQPELKAYFERIVDKYDLRRHCRFGTLVTRMEWDQGAGGWQVHTQQPDGRTKVSKARFVISAVGSLNLPNLPDIPGAELFGGPSFHSARWPADLNLAGQRLALIGAGASGFQIAPTIAPILSRLSIFQRTAQWIIPNRLYHAAVPAGDRWALRHLPFYGRWYRLIMSIGGIAAGTEPYRIDPSHSDPSSHSVNADNERRAAALLSWMTSVLVDRPDLVEKITPDYPALGKRVLQDNGSWLRCLTRENVDLIRTPIKRIVRAGVETDDGTVHPVDVICYATGFRHNDFLASMEVQGRNRSVLREQWGDAPTAYLGITIPNFPNLACIYGPGTNLAAGASLFYHSEFQVHYAMELIGETLKSGRTTFEVRASAHDEYVTRYRQEISSLVWSHPSIRHSHFKNPSGEVFTLSPWPLDQYWSWTRSVDVDDYEFA